MLELTFVIFNIYFPGVSDSGMRGEKHHNLFSPYNPVISLDNDNCGSNLHLFIGLTAGLVLLLFVVFFFLYRKIK